MIERAQFIVLCEDIQAQAFIYRALLDMGAIPQRIRVVPLPAKVDGGAGHAYVLAKYPPEVRSFRSRNARASTRLVVHVDADPTHTVAQRRAELAAALHAAGHSPRAPDEPIAQLIPKRNIETWIHALDETLAQRLWRPLDEQTEYPKLDCESDCAQAARSFAEHSRKGTPPEVAKTIPSLADGIAELRRLA